jgi:hypothetical protein
MDQIGWRIKRMSIIRAGATVLIVFFMAGGLSWAQADRPATPPASSDGGLFTGTPEEQAACSPDAVKFCRDDIPAAFAVLACLQKHRDKLKKACREVLKSHSE